MLIKIKNYIVSNKIELIKYIISGSAAAVVDFALLYAFTEFLGIWSVVSSILAFLGAFGVSFTLQKFWTFKDNGTDNIHGQLTLYLGVSALDLILNTVGMYFLVERLHLWYMLAQFIISGIISVWSFIVYKFVIFKKHNGD